MDYVTIIQGDDTNFLDDQFLLVTFDTDIDLSGFTAIFSLEDVTLTYGNLSSKTFNIILSNDITSNLTIGKKYGEIKLIDTSNRIKTITSVIPFLIKKGVNEDIRISNSSLNVTMNVNNTVIDVVVETPGISKTEAQKILASCNEAVQQTQNNANTSINVLNQLNELNELIEEANTACEDGVRAIAMASQDKLSLIITKGNEVEGIAQEALDILDSRADKDLEELSDVGKAKLGGNRFCINTGPLDSSRNPNALTIDDTPALGEWDSWMGFGDERFVILSGPLTYIDGNGIANSFDYKIDEEVTNYEAGNYSIQVYKDTDSSYKLKLVKDCTVYKSKKEPSLPNKNDLWLDTSKSPFKAYCYAEVTFSEWGDGVGFEDWCEWQETNLVEIGKLQKTSSDEYTITNFQYNPTISNIPDYSLNKYVAKNQDLVAESSGALIGNIISSTPAQIYVNNNLLPIVPSGFQGSFYIPLCVGDVYKITNYNECGFFPFIS